MTRSLFLVVLLAFLRPGALSAAENAGAAVSILSTDTIRVAPLQVGEPRLYDSKPLRVIEKIPDNLGGWQFTAIPQRVIISYKIHVIRDGVIYAFGGGSTRHPPTREQFLGDDAARWTEAPGVIAGTNIPMCFRRNVTAGETISLHSFELSLAAENIALGEAREASIAAIDLAAAEGRQSPLEVLSKQGPNAVEWALAPLDRAVPDDIRQNLTLLREDLRDEEAKQPASSVAPYKLGDDLCNKLLATLNERENARVRAGYTAAQAKVNMGEITNQALEARRTSAIPAGRHGSAAWPAYFREKDQRDELRTQKQNGAALENQRPILEWANRSAEIRQILDANYAQYREAVRRFTVAK